MILAKNYCNCSTEEIPVDQTISHSTKWGLPYYISTLCIFLPGLCVLRCPTLYWRASASSTPQESCLERSRGSAEVGALPPIFLSFTFPSFFPLPPLNDCPLFLSLVHFLSCAPSYLSPYSVSWLFFYFFCALENADSYCRHFGHTRSEAEEWNWISCITRA